jgi:hypothetical protein
MTKKVGIKAWQEIGDSALNIANRLGRQKLKRVFCRPKCYLCPGGSLASSRMGQTCPKISYYPSFLKFFIKNCDFLHLARFFVPEHHVFLAIFWAFFNNRYAVFLMNGLRYH